MAIPLKNGADLYNFEVLRMRFHNLGADPTSDFGVGQVYFNTSTSEGSGKRVRIYDGSAFRSLAYFDEFTALQTKVNAFLDGGVDADGVLENLAEIQKFLDNYSSATDLSEILDTKLDKTGGTINGTTNAPLVIDTSSTSENGIKFRVAGSNKSWVGYSSTRGTMLFSYANGMSYAIGIGDDHVPFFGTSSTRNTLLHSGNVGEYKAGDSDKLGGQTLAWVQGNGLKIRRVKTATSTNPADANVDLEGGGMIYSYSAPSSITNRPSGMGFGHIWQVGSYGSDILDGQFAWDNNHNSREDTTGNLWWRVRDSVNGWTYAKWHQIAFTDSNVASAQALVHSNGTVGATAGALGELCLSAKGIWSADGAQSLFEYSSTDLWIGYSMRKAQLTRLYGNRVGIYTGDTQAMLINSSGNVTIGDSDLAGTDAKLYVDGRVYTKTAFLIDSDYGIWKGGQYTGALAVTDLVYNATKHAFVNGNVGIGTTKPTEKLHVVGNLYVTGNIIADGEVSAGGAGEEGDTGTGTGGGDALIYSQEFTPTTTSITITHNLSATKGVIVQVWEKNGNYWDMVLVDVEEVDTNTVTLFFGKTETTVHKVVIMG